eukprot:5047869-Amphidinium_carterae.1
MEVVLTEGEPEPLVVEYIHNAGTGFLRLYWASTQFEDWFSHQTKRAYRVSVGENSSTLSDLRLNLKCKCLNSPSRQFLKRKSTAYMLSEKVNDTAMRRTETATQAFQIGGGSKIDLMSNSNGPLHLTVSFVYVFPVVKQNHQTTSKRDPSSKKEQYRGERVRFVASFAKTPSR